MANKVAIEVEIKNIKQIKVLENQLKKLRKEQRELAKTNKEAKKLSGEEAKLYERKHKAITKASKALRENKKALADVNKGTKTVTKSSNGMAKQFVKGAAAIGIIVGAFRAVNRIVSSVISVFSEFEFVMAKVNAVSGATESEFKDLTATAEELGRTTFFTASQVGELMLNFSKLGFTAREIQDAVQPTLDLATATGSDLARAALVAGAAVRGFGLDASETQRVVDVMAVSFSSSAMNIEKWQTSMTKVAPIAKAAGFSIEDTAAIMSKLTDSGIEASIAGTSLRNILLKMQDPTSELSMRFGKTIHSLDELVPAMKQFVAEGGSMADVMEVVDIRQAAAFEQMLTTADGTLALRDALVDANGEGARMAGIVGDTLQGAFLKFTSAIQGLSISVMKGFAEGMQGMVENIASFFNVLAQNSKTIIFSIKWITKLAKWFGILKLVVFAFGGGLKSLIVTSKIYIGITARMTAMNAGLTLSMRTLKVAVQSLWSATGFGMLVVVLSEVVPWLLKTKDASVEVMEETERLTKSYHDSLEPIEKLTIASKELIRLKGLMNDMVEDGLIVLDKEGKAVKGTAVDIEIYNRRKGQAAIHTRVLNEALTNNDQALLTEKTSIENVASAINILTTALTNQALAKGFSKQLEQITQDIASAAIAEQEIAELFGVSPERLKDMFDENGDVILKGIGMYADNAADLNAENLGLQMSTMEMSKILKEGGFDSFKEIGEVMGSAEAKTKTLTNAYDKLAGKDGIAAVLLAQQKLGDTTTTTGTTVTKWSDKMAAALLVVKQNYSAVGASAEDYKDATITATKSVLNEELSSLNKLEKKTKGQADRIIQIKTKLADLTMQQNDISFKKELDGLTDTYNTEKTLLANKYTVNGQITETGNAMLLNLEATYLSEKGALHGKYGEKILGIDAQIAASNQKIADQQRKLMEEQVSAMGGVGSALTSLAGDNEKLNFIKEAGNKISMVANTLSTIATLKTNLNTLAEGEFSIAKLFSNTTEQTGIALDKIDIVQKGAKIGLLAGEATGNTVGAGAIATNTIATLANTVATTISLIPKAISAVLSSAMGSGPFGIFAAIAMFGFIKKLMKWKGEDGGIVPSDNKYANGGMVHGKSHAQGGEKFSVGGRVNELEGGEAVINKRSTAMFRNQLSAMNQAGGGVKFADGGLMSSPQFAEAQFDANNQSQMRGAMQNQRKVVVVESDITDTQSTVSTIQANATF